MPVSPARGVSRDLLERALEGPEYCGLANFVFSRQRCHGLALGVPFGDLALLADIERGWPAELLALLPGLGDADLGARQDQRAWHTPASPGGNTDLTKTPDCGENHANAVPWAIRDAQRRGPIPKLSAARRPL